MLPSLLLLFSLLHMSQGQADLAAAVASLQALLKPGPPQGQPFPRIQGPQTHERVCIVGAGPAGIHMALSLKRRGYINLTIYEKSGRVGGKAYDIKYRGVANFMGASLADPNYFDNLISLVEEYGAGEYLRVAKFTNSSLLTK